MKDINEITSKIIEYFKSFYESKEEDVSLRDNMDNKEENMDYIKSSKAVCVEANNDEFLEPECSFTSQPKDFLTLNGLKASAKLYNNAIERQLELQGQLVVKSSEEVDASDKKVLKESYRTNAKQQLGAKSNSVAKSFKVTGSYASNVDAPSHYQADTQKVSRQVQGGRGRGS